MKQTLLLFIMMLRKGPTQRWLITSSTMNLLGSVSLKLEFSIFLKISLITVQFSVLSISNPFQWINLLKMKIEISLNLVGKRPLKKKNLIMLVVWKISFPVSKFQTASVAWMWIVRILSTAMISIPSSPASLSVLNLLLPVLCHRHLHNNVHLNQEELFRDGKIMWNHTGKMHIFGTRCGFQRKNQSILSCIE